MKRLLRIAFAATALAVGGCDAILLNLPDEYPLSTYTGKQLGVDEAFQFKGDQSQLKELLQTNYSPPWMWNSYPNEYALNLSKGQELFQKHCIHCHGLAGGGDGPTAPFVFPRPRDYRSGKFKWKSTTRTEKPTREDLVNFIKEGAEGTSMPPFKLLPEIEVNAITDYVIYLSKRGEFERWLLQEYAANEELPSKNDAAAKSRDLDKSWASAAKAVVQPEESRPPLAFDSKEFEDSIWRGRALYMNERASCYKCHNDDGQANPDKMDKSEKDKMFDDWGFKNYPRNLTLGLFRGGRRPIDLYRRVHQGVNAAQMPAAVNPDKRNLKDEEIWDLVNFIRALPYRPDLLAKKVESTTTQPAAAKH